MDIPTIRPKKIKTGGRQKGTKNKTTIARQQAIEEALRTIRNANGTGVYDGDAHGPLMLVYKNEAFPLDVRTRAAEAALKFEKPALAAVDLKATVEQTYVVRMPEPCATLEEWKAKYVDAAETLVSDAEWNERLERIKMLSPPKGSGQ